MNNKYSIVVTVYNAEKYFEKCLESVKNQTYTNWELVIVNDGSSDSSGAIAEKYMEEINSFGDSRGVIYIEQENKGAVFSREKGICRTTGKYVFFLDADDYWDSCLLELIDNVIHEYNVDIIQYGYRFVDENGEYISDAGYTQKGGTKTGETIVEGEKNVFVYKALRTCYCLWGRAFRRELFDTKEGYYREYYNINMTNDLLQFSRPLSLAKTFCFTDYYLYNYRIVKDSLCHDVSVEKICSYFRSLGWAERCMREVNGDTIEHKEFFAERISNIVFDEYREHIYSSTVKEIKTIYTATEEINGLAEYIDLCLKEEMNWYKKLYLVSFKKRRIIFPKLLYVYSKLRQWSMV